MSRPSILQKLKETRSEDDPLSDASIQDFKNRITGSGIYDRSKDGGLDKWELSKLQTDNRARIKKLMNNGKVYDMHDGPIYNRSKDGGLSEGESEKLLNTIAIRDRSQDGGLSEGEFETPPASIYNRSKDGGLSEKESKKLLADASIQDVMNRITGSGIYDRRKDGGLSEKESKKLLADASIQDVMNRITGSGIYDRSKDGGLSEKESKELLADIAMGNRRNRPGGLSEGEFEKLLNTIAIHDRSQDGGLSEGETTVLNDYSKMWLIANLLGSNHPDTIKQRNNNPNWEDPISIDDETGSITYTLGGQKSSNTKRIKQDGKPAPRGGA